MPADDLASSPEGATEYDFIDYILEEYYLYNDLVRDAPDRTGLTPEQYLVARLPEGASYAFEDEPLPPDNTAPDLDRDGYGVDWTPALADPELCIAAAGPYSPQDLANEIDCIGQIWVPYVNPGSPAETVTLDNGTVVSLKRGDSIQAINGIDLTAYRDSDGDGIHDALELLFDENGPELDLYWVAPGGAPRNGTIPAANRHQVLAYQPRIFDGTIGYLNINQFSFGIEAELADLFSTTFSGVDELIIDIRYTVGGPLAVASELAYMVAGSARTDGRNFSLNRFNPTYSGCGVDPVYPDNDLQVPFYNQTIEEQPGRTLPSLALDRVFVLVNSYPDTLGSATQGAGEAFISALNGIGFNTVVIGGETAGDNQGLYPLTYGQNTYYIPMFEVVNDSNDTYTNGDFVTAGCELISTEDTNSSPLGDPNEDLLAMALRVIREDLSGCP